jgi:hypothetical protein
MKQLHEAELLMSLTSCRSSTMAAKPHLEMATEIAAGSPLRVVISDGIMVERRRWLRASLRPLADSVTMDGDLQNDRPISVTFW